ncbi:histidine phosphatase family protein [Tanticharoenia sakaeratensis]|jgi:alpha-ribazole phosphatase|uniref:DNA translocase ftsK n=1 Tax=Tanticharoenia sakaeratensis NBRC 103193 TaxID=1231623 RepID=A0A0D6MMM7_9PROT|nr:histidine phosphatase family protein [Tanticharoenia sakaeratensis]GAN54701.1 DNA translocase ftsK [Tanticharoenia sakaeratensis NBRC 103193]GBQ16849.1 phosphoglycerate mutase [Tanticharoenia sakaeratensis NBRC 103193]
MTITTAPSPKPHGHFLDAPRLPRGITRFWLIRHALVNPTDRQFVYGSQDVVICPDDVIRSRPTYEAIAERLPQDAAWYASPLSRTHQTAQAIFDAGYGQRSIEIDPRLSEQSMGDWHGLPHGDLPARLTRIAHRFWSIAAAERPPQGESMLDVCARVAHALDDLADRHPGSDTVIVSHGGAIRAALAHALDIHPDTALRFSIQNLALSIIERIDGHWRVVGVNELPLPRAPL